MKTVIKQIKKEGGSKECSATPLGVNDNGTRMTPEEVKKYENRAETAFKRYAMIKKEMPDDWSGKLYGLSFAEKHRIQNILKDKFDMSYTVDEFAEACDAYLAESKEKGVATIEGLCAYMGISKAFFEQCRNGERGFEEYVPAAEGIATIIESDVIEKGLKGEYRGDIVKFYFTRKEKSEKQTGNINIVFQTVKTGNDIKKTDGETIDD